MPGLKKTTKRSRGYSRKLARSIGSRIYVTIDGRLMIVNGEPNYHSLLSALESSCGVPAVANAPDPNALGIAPLCDGEVSVHGLRVRGKALQRWRRESSAPNTTREIDALQERLATLYDWHQRAQAGELPEGAPYFLDAAQRADLDDALATAEFDRDRFPFIRWLARIVFWFGGRASTTRFLTAIDSLRTHPEDVEQTNQLQRFHQQLHTWKSRSEFESARALRTELREALKRLPDQVVSQAKLGSRLRGVSFEEHCDRLIKRTAKLLDQARMDSRRLTAVTLAAVVVCDQSEQPLPRALTTDLMEASMETILDRQRRQFYRLMESARRPGYDALLKHLDYFWPEIEPEDYARTVAALERGTRREDVKWLLKSRLLAWFEVTSVKARWIRRMSTTLDDCRVIMTPSQKGSLLSVIREEKHKQLVDKLLGWLRRIPAAVLTPRMRLRLRDAICDELIPAMSLATNHRALTQWMQLPRKAATLTLPSGSPAELGQPLAWLEHFQTVAGREVSLPKSLRKYLDAESRIERERAYLVEQSHAGSINEAMAARLAHLATTDPTARTKQFRKFSRVAHNVALVTALEGLTQAVRHEISEFFVNSIGSTPAQLPFKDLQAMSQWITDMSAAERQLLRAILTACDQNGADYKRQLPHNREWLRKATANGMNLQAWLQPAMATVATDRGTLRIEVSHQPFQTFMMGNYFGTCLSLGDCNEMSVLANAADANKQVLYVYDDAGTVVARKLLAVGSEFRLLGYCCYINHPHQQDEEAEVVYRKQVSDHVNAYCGRLAHDANLPLGDNGEPDYLGDHFWYDDDAEPWEEAASNAWHELQPAAKTNQLPSGFGFTEIVA